MEGQSKSRERRRRWIRLSCWLLVALVVVAGGPLGLLIRSARGKHRAVLALRQRGAAVGYREPKLAQPDHQLERHEFLQDLWVEVALVDLGDRDVGDDDLAALEEFPDLETLVLRNTRVSDAGLSRLERLRRLKYLDLHGTQVGDATLTFVGEERDLQDLDLGETRVTDAGIERLSQLGQLRSLDLSGTGLSEAALESLGRLSQLKWLGLANVHIDRRALDAWAQAHPQVAVSGDATETASLPAP